jgi:selenocysteine lyase/cysteine desulfurase
MELVSVTPPPRTSPSIPPIVGADLRVPLANGKLIRYANLDHAASTPCLGPVQDAVNELLPWYASVHRGSGFASQVSSRVYESARQVLRAFVGAPATAAVVFTRNTTDALNLLAHSVPEATTVVVFDTEHHAAMLPWQGPGTIRLRTPPSVDDTVDVLDTALATAPSGPRLVVLTGASNVTGELWPIVELAAVARRHGARVVLDAAQLAPHRLIDITAWQVDYVVLSGHKLYAPFGAGALVGPVDWLRAAEPYLVGGGATAQVTAQPHELIVSWSDVPDRHEAGSPNVVGVHALAAACRALTAYRDEIGAHEAELLRQLRNGLATVPGLAELSLFGAPRVGVVSFAIERQDPGLLAAALSAEYGIGVREGAFCAHIATSRLLLRAGSAHQRAIRASLGLGNTIEDVERLVGALHVLSARGPQLRYARVGGQWVPERDLRPWPSFAL